MAKEEREEMEKKYAKLHEEFFESLLKEQVLQAGINSTEQYIMKEEEEEEEDYENENGNLVMTTKISGDNQTELSEIYQAWVLWADNQRRFESVEELYGGLLYKGSTNVWLSNDGNFVRMVLVQDLSIINAKSLSDF